MSSFILDLLNSYGFINEGDEMWVHNGSTPNDKSFKIIIMISQKDKSPFPQINLEWYENESKETAIFNEISLIQTLVAAEKYSEECSADNVGLNNIGYVLWNMIEKIDKHLFE